MASLFEIGKTGVQAYRQALSVTGQNIANINTEGYNKRSADITEIAGVSGGATNVSDSSGLGVRVANIRRSFDSYLSDKTRTSQSDYEMLNDFVSKLSDLENMLLPSGSDLGVFIGRFFDSLQDVASSPDSISARTVSLEAGRALSSSFNNYDKQLKDFKSSSIRQVDVKLTEANLYLNQLVKVNGLISGSGSKDASNDILDARDQLLKDLSKLLNFTVDYESTGEVNIRLGDSGNGLHILQRSKAAILSSSSTENNISIIVNNAGVKNTGIFSSGIISGLSQFYSLVDSVTSEISDLAQQMTDQINNIQTSGIDLNGNIGKSMFSVNSMSPKANSDNKSFLEFNSIVNNPSNITQEQVLVNYSQINNNWEVRNSNGVSYAYGNQIQFEGYKIEITGQPQDGDGFVISPLQTKAGSMKFNLNNPEDFAAASKNLISKNSANTGSVDLNIIGSIVEQKLNFPPKTTDIFTSSNNPLVATTFLKDGPVTTIPSTTKSINLSSIGNQSSATFTIADSEIKGFSTFNIKLDNNNEISFNSAATDPGDGIKTVEELANLLNSGLMLDGKSQHDFRTYGLFASGSNGYLTITSSLSDITSGSILSKGNSYSPSISNIPAASSVGSNIQVFTRDGRHVSGTSLNASQIASLIKSENGFLDTAEYRNDYLNNDYRGIDLSRKTASGDFVKNFGSNISYNEQSTDMDGLLTAQIVSSGSISLNGQKQYSKELNSNITIACEKDETGRSFTINGYDLDGIYQTETITGGNVTTVKGSKVFREVLSISINGNSTGKVTIGLEAVSSSLKLTNEDNIAKTTNIPVGSSAYYVANKLTSELAGTGVNVTASNKVMLGPLEEGVSGAVTFDLKGKNTEAVSINASVASTDLSMLAKNINEYASQTGLTAVLTSDFKQIIIESQDGYNINFKNITAPSDFYLETLGKDFTNQNSQKNPKLLIDVSNTNKSSANIKGEIKFVSSENFSIQTDTGIISSAIKDPLKNGYISINTSKSGESATITPEVFNDLDNSVGSPDGKKAVVGLSKYGLDINQKDYTLYVSDADSLYQDANPGVAGTLSLNGKLKDANNLNAVVSVYCSASETGNTFTVTGTNLSGTTITENITGGSVGTTVYGSTIFQTITSVTTSATASGNIKVGTLGYNAINDDDSLVEWSSFSSGSLTMDGVLSTSDYLGAKIKIKSEQDTTGTSFVIAGLGLDNQVLTETISGSNSGVVTTSNIFKSVTSINSSGTSNGNIKIGTEAADGDWDTIIDANSVNADTDIEVSTALLSSLRTETPTSQLKGIVLNSLPSEGQSIDLSFEGQIYKLNMVSGDLVVEGPEKNRIQARFNGTSETISNLLAISQSGTALTPLIINGLNSVTADSDGLVDNETLGSAGNFTIDGALSSTASSNLKSTVSISSSSNNASVTFTITGTDIDGVAQTETITGVNANTVNGTKFFKTVSQISSDAAASNINVGTVSGFGSTSGTRISITSTANESNNSFTIVGTDTDGLTKTETITGPISGNTVSTTGLFKTVVSITPNSNTVGNIEIGTSPGYQLIATAEGTIEGAQFKLVPTTTNINNAEAFGLKSATTTILGNLVVQPTVADSTPAIAIEVNENNIKSNYSIKFNSSNVPVFYNSAGSEVSGSPPSGITLSWNETSGLTDDDSIYNSNMSAGVAIVTSGILSTTDDDSLFTSKSGIAGDLILDGALNNSKSLNGKVTVFCNGNETSNSFVVSGYDTSGVYQTDTITGVSGATATGSISFNEILSLSVANNTVSTIKIGTQATQVVMDPQVVTITPAGSDVGELYTITGLDQFGKTQTEVMTAQSAGTTVIGEKVFSQITSIVATSSSASTVKVGTQKVGRLSISHTIDDLDFKIMGNPIANDIYGIKTQNIRAIVDNQGLKVSSFSGDPIKIDIPDNSIQNSVAEKVSLTNLPPEDLITIVLGGGARKISAEYDQYTASENLNNEINPELTIKVDATNKNKVEIFDKKSGHSIASRILDVNRVFEVNNTKFQFSEEALVNNSFEFSSNKDGYGDNRNIINILNLQRSDPSETNKGNFQEIFNTTVAKVGSNVQANKLSLNSASSTLDAAEASQSEFAGVNLDEEAARLLEFQQAYQASARILQTAKELFQSLIEVV
ncbi:flagellar basal body rod C-terminal domain-containing protein [Alphaproteobacteria bacterium]|nr:flagellar basal body rod C-terminal domain-containing protein [Alphaproteobacteria bacterium]